MTASAAWFTTSDHQGLSPPSRSAPTTTRPNSTTASGDNGSTVRSASGKPPPAGGQSVAFRSCEFDQAIRHFVHHLRRDADRDGPIYLADRYFMNDLTEIDDRQLYLDMFAATAGRRRRADRTTGYLSTSRRPWLRTRLHGAACRGRPTDRAPGGTPPRMVQVPDRTPRSPERLSPSTSGMSPRNFNAVASSGTGVIGRTGSGSAASRSRWRCLERISTCRTGSLRGAARCR